jgi:hypothetical protein
MANSWMEHVKSVRKQNPKKSLKDVLKMASKSYKKSGANKTAKVAKRGKDAKRGRKSTRRRTRGSRSRGRGRSRSRGRRN